MKFNFNKFRNTKIVVFGDIFLDEYIDGLCHRLSPESPIPILNYSKNKFNLGGSGNVVSNLANIGVKVSICSQISNDEFSLTIRNLLKDLGIKSINLFTNKKIDTIIKTRITSQNHQFIRLDKEPLDIGDYNFFPKEIHLNKKYLFI